jgi:hypothetical protein
VTLTGIVGIISVGKENAGFTFLSTMHGHAMLFLVIFPVLLLFFLRVFRVVGNPLILTRHYESSILFFTYVKTIVFSSVIFVILKTAVEIIPVIISGDIGLISPVINDYALCILVELLTVISVLALWMVFYRLTGKIVLSSMLIYLLIAIDFLTCILPLFGNHYIDLGIYMRPMGVVNQMIVSLSYGTEFPAITKEIFFGMMKIAVVFTTLFAFTVFRRKEVLS